MKPAFNIIKHVRDLTGLSQYKLAEWLGVSRGLVNLAEKGKRQLPHAASMKINAMTLLLEQMKEAGKETVIEQITVSDPAKLALEHKKKMLFYQKKAAALQAQLDKLKSVHPKINSRLALLNALGNNDIEWFNTTPADNKWIEMTEWFTRENISVSSLEEQGILQGKIEVQLEYAEIHKRRFEKFSSDNSK